MIKKRFLFLLCNALLFFAFSCKKECFQIVPVASFEPITDYYPDFKEYCQLDFNNGLFEINAVKASFFGDVKTSIDQADKDAQISNDQFVMFDNLNEGQINSFKEQYLKILADSTIEKADSLEAKTILNLLDGPKDVKSTFKNAHLVDAIEYLKNRAEDYNFTLINEAHYCSQHRNFTARLLQPFWEKGYRYLALEALSPLGENSLKLGKALDVKSGYYLQDAHFANLVRVAKELGYTIVAYEDQNGFRGSKRDSLQASNIIRKTLGKDKKGKVLIHAGYGHINELGDSRYSPLGEQLKKYINEDVFTIDQESMTGKIHSVKMNQYYNECLERFELKEPSVLLDANKEPIGDLNQINSVDVQVYHPMTTFTHSRADWEMVDNSKKLVKLPKSITDKEGFLCSIYKTNEKSENKLIPYDQFIISKDVRAILPPGHFYLELVDAEGTLSSKFDISVCGN